jgi:RecA-family ATPase
MTTGWDDFIRGAAEEQAADEATARAHQANGSVSLDITIASDLADKPVPERDWLVPHWIPSREVTLLSGDGGVGKSLAAMQLQIAAAARCQWLGLPVMPCRMLGIYAEDEQAELHRRLAALAELMGVNIADLSDMAWRSAVSDDADLVVPDDRGIVRPTAYFHRLEEQASAFDAGGLILDAATNFFGADEIRRRQVNGFMRLLRQFAAHINGPVILLAHPSVAGLTSGSGLSGSTHWHNATRSRLYLTRTAGEDADPDERELTRLKANYAGVGDVLRLRWQQGGFIALDPPSGIDRIALNSKADRVFRSLLNFTYAEGTWTSPNPAAANYAPRTMSKRPDREGLGKPALEAAMHRLLKTGQIATETYGRPSEPRTRLAVR